MWDSNLQQCPRIPMLHILNLSADAKQFCHDIPDMVGGRRYSAGNYVSVSHRRSYLTIKRTTKTSHKRDGLARWHFFVPGNLAGSINLGAELTARQERPLQGGDFLRSSAGFGRLRPVHHSARRPRVGGRAKPPRGGTAEPHPMRGRVPGQAASAFSSSPQRLGAPASSRVCGLHVKFTCCNSPTISSALRTQN